MSDGMKKIRGEIDAIDGDIIRLLNQRAACARRIGKLKSGDGGDFHRPEREAQVLRRAKAAAKEMNATDAARIFREIISACLAGEAAIRVAYLGPAGTFCYEAARAHFGGAVETEAADSIAAAFAEAEKQRCHFAVAPIENSSEGAVGAALDLLLETPLAICGETFVRIRHCLLSQTECAPEEVRAIYAHPQSFGQCRLWLARHAPKAELTACASNAAAAKRASQGAAAQAGVATAAIAPAYAADIYKLHIAAADIEDDPANTTRFIVLGAKDAAPSGDDKTSLAMMAARDEAGALFSLLEPFAKHGVNMNKFESRPARRGRPWDYVFFADIDGHRDDAKIARALSEIGKRAAYLKILGSYPRAASRA
jgi:chorismate mutase/prephenate dehydratase